MDKKGNECFPIEDKYLSLEAETIVSPSKHTCSTPPVWSSNDLHIENEKLQVNTAAKCSAQKFGNSLYFLKCCAVKGLLFCTSFL